MKTAAVIRVIDLETTGFAPPEHVPIEIGWCDLHARATDLAGTPCLWQVVRGGAALVDPAGVAVPPESSAVHHLVAADVDGAAHWPLAAATALAAGAGPLLRAYAAHSAKMERQWLTDEMTGGRPWICTWKCALRAWPDAPSHSNQALRYWRNLDLAAAGLVPIPAAAHRAEPDAIATAYLLRDLLDEHPLEQLVAWSAEPALGVRIPFGDYKGQRWADVHAADPADLASFCDWVLRRDFDEDLKFTATHWLNRIEADAEVAGDGATDPVGAP